MQAINKISVHNPSRNRVWHMFDRIASRYDLLNRLLSFRQDVRWRRHMAELLPVRNGLNVLDVATGTADQLIALHKYARHRISSSIGVDMADQMLEIGRNKIKKEFPKAPIYLESGDATSLPCDDERFDVVTITFGIRNVMDVHGALLEMYRVLKPEGRLLVLEFSLPKNIIVKKIYLFYFRYILPVLGGLISGNLYAYRYLNETVETFPFGKDFIKMMEGAGFSECRVFPLTFGIASIYVGEKTNDRNEQ
jgi:demethylmenaquinone methyltransferase/2-methoxy-6-polyprenyl-1,4-benzoquinol methylase